MTLSGRQMHLLTRLAEGATCRQIARELGVSEVTARGYLHRMRAVLGAATNAHAVHLAHQHRLLDHLAVPEAIPPAEAEVLRHAAAGHSNAEIAALLDRSEHTVADQVRRVRQRLGARDRTHAVAIAIGRGIIAAEAEGEAA